MPTTKSCWHQRVRGDYSSRSPTSDTTSFGISSAPGYFQEIMDQLTRDLQGVAVYMDDILVSGATASEHLQYLRSLLKRLQDKGLHCHCCSTVN